MNQTEFNKFSNYNNIYIIVNFILFMQKKESKLVGVVDDSSSIEEIRQYIKDAKYITRKTKSWYNTCYQIGSW